MVSKPTIFIGIGSSGLYVLEQLQNFCYENTGKNKPDGVEYLYLETNKENTPSVTVLKNQIKRVYISLASMETMVRELRDRKHLSNAWLPPEEHVLDAGIGAGGIPSCGRLALWGSNTEGNNLTNVIEAIRNAYTIVGSHTVTMQDNSAPTVFITGSLTGGTGSGVFIDLAYLVRHIIIDVKELFGLLLLPPKPANFAGNEIIYTNTFGALTALKHYNEPDNKYEVSLPNEDNLKYPHPPFELVQFISQSYNAVLPDIQSLNGLYRIAGLYLFLNVVGLRAKRMERLVDSKGNMQIGKNSTFGLSAIQYPKSQIKESIALEFGSELLRKWIDQKNFYQGGQATPINRGIIVNKIKEVFTSFLNEALNTLNAGGGHNILPQLRQEAIRVNKGSHSGTREQHLAKLYSSAQVGNWYDTVRNNIQLAQDAMISSISTFIINEFNLYENAYYVRNELDAFADSIDECLKYWKSLGISSVAANWENMLGNKQVPWMLKKRFGFIMEEDNVLEDRMRASLDLMKFHLFGKSLENIKNNIKTGDIPFVTATRQERQTLPVIHKIDGIIRSIQVVLGEVEDAKFKSLEKRKMEIASDMKDVTIPILRIFPSGDFDTEVRQSIARYRQRTGETAPQKETLVGGQTLWDYLNDKDGKLIFKLYHDCILKFGERLETIACVEDYDVSNYVERHPQDAVKIAGRSKFYMLPIHNKTLENIRNIPRMVIGSDKEVIQDVIEKLQSENFLEFSTNPDHILEIRELKNIMVFYIEKGNFEPVDDIAYMEVVKRLYDEYPKRRGGKIEQYWHNFRMPYLTLNQAAAIQNQNKGAKIMPETGPSEEKVSS